MNLEPGVAQRNAVDSEAFNGELIAFGRVGRKVIELEKRWELYLSVLQSFHASKNGLLL